MVRKFSLSRWAALPRLAYLSSVALVSAGTLTSLTGCGGGDEATVASNSSSAPAPTAPPSPPAGYAPTGSNMPSGSSGGSSGGSSEGSSGGANSSGQQIQMDNPEGDGTAIGAPAGYSGGAPGAGPMGTSSGIGVPNETGEGMVNSGGGYSGAPLGTSSGIGAPTGDSSGLANSGGSSAGGAPGKGGYSGGPAGVSGGVPGSGGPTPADMAGYANSSGGSSGGPGVPSTPGLPSLGDGGIGAPAGASGGPGMIGAPGGLPGSGIPSQAPPPGPQKPAEDAPYIEKAKYAFAIGREPDAYKFLMAHMLSGAEDAATYLDEVRWVKDLLNPASGVTFAVGVDLKAPPTITDYKPIGSVTTNNGPGGGGLAPPGAFGSEGGMVGAGGGGIARKDDPAMFEKTTGELGRAFVRMFEERFREGKFGTAFTDVENAAGAIESAPTGGGIGVPGASGGSSGLAGIAPLGTGPEGMMAPGMRGGVGGPGGIAAKPKGTGHRLTPGLAYIGTGSAGELKTKATKDGFDCLIVFDVQVEQNKRTGRVANDARVQLVSLKTGKIIASSKRLNNIEVQKKMEEGEGDGIDAALQVVFSKVDDLVILSPMPSLKPDVVQKRVSDLANSKSVPALKSLTEVCLFHHLKLMNDEERSAAYELLLEGAYGTTLGTGSTEEKREVLDKLVPKL